MSAVGNERSVSIPHLRLPNLPAGCLSVYRHAVIEDFRRSARPDGISEAERALRGAVVSRSPRPLGARDTFYSSLSVRGVGAGRRQHGCNPIPEKERKRRGQ